jgi:hypothetical protein
VVGAAVVSGLMIFLASTVQGPDSLGAVLFAGIGIFVMFLFVVFVVVASARRSQRPQAPDGSRLADSGQPGTADPTPQAQQAPASVPPPNG